MSDIVAAAEDASRFGVGELEIIPSEMGATISKTLPSNSPGHCKFFFHISQ